MNKKTIFSIIALSLCFCLGAAKITIAEEGIMVISETEGTPISEDTVVEGSISLDDIDDSDDFITTTNTETDTSSDNFYENSGDAENETITDADYNGTSDEPLVVCASTDEPGCEDEAIDPEMWPLYISLGALGVTIILVIIINLIGHRKK